MQMRTGLGADRAAFLARLARAAAQPVDATWFEAETPHGPLRLCVGSPDGAARHAAGAAIVLHDCEPLLAGLDEWSGPPLAWRWTQSPAAVAVPGAAHIEWRAARARLACPWAWLRERRAPRGTWADELQWPAVPARLVGARLRLPTEALGTLEPGGALVVPQSMMPSWHGVLSAADETADGGGVTVALAGVAGASADAPLFAPGFNAAASLLPYGDAADALCELRLELPNPLAADRLAGWSDGPVGPAGPRAELWRCADASGAARRLAAGRLMPWGDGHALAVEVLADTSRTTLDAMA